MYNRGRPESMSRSREGEGV